MLMQTLNENGEIVHIIVDEIIDEIIVEEIPLVATIEDLKIQVNDIKQQTQDVEDKITILEGDI